MANRPEEGQSPRRQIGEVLVMGGALALIGTPIVYRLRAGSNAGGTWWWPTWWMLLPLGALLLGLVLRAIPASFDLRRSLFRTRVASRRRERT